MAKYKGKNVTTKPVDQNHPKYNASTPQTIVVDENGTETVVPTSEISQ